MIKVSAQMIETGDTIFLGSTAREVMGAYKGKDHVRIIYQDGEQMKSTERASTDKVRIQ